MLICLVTLRSQSPSSRLQGNEFGIGVMRGLDMQCMDIYGCVTIKSCLDGSSRTWDVENGIMY
jgi:hypothetical protein